MRSPRSRHFAATRTRPRPRLVLTVDPLESRIVLDGDIALLSATTLDSRGVEVHYNLTPPEPGAGMTAEIAIFRSSDPTFSADDLPIAADQVQLVAGEHTVTVGLPETLAIDPSHRYVLAVADPPDAIDEVNEGNNTASFRMFTLGVVTHGFELFPSDTAWIDTMANSLELVGYDDALAFHWDTLSGLPIPGVTPLVGFQLAVQVAGATHQLEARMGDDDVIALHLIGHSRGTVVISQAALNLEHFEQVLPDLAPLKAGPLKMTFLDPHPANNLFTGTLFSAAPNLIGRIGTGIFSAFQTAMRDPNVVVPASADWAEVFFQHTPFANAEGFPNTYFNIWGETASDINVSDPTSTVVSSIDLTNIARSHSQVHVWYQVNVVPSLGGGGESGRLRMASIGTGSPDLLGVNPPSLLPDGPLARGRFVPRPRGRLVG